jgi:4-hydroxybenzoate polyprenyltransferase
MSELSSPEPGRRVNAYWRLMRFDRPIGILLLLWPTYWALWIAAGGMPSLKNGLIFTAGVVVMRAAGCVANDLADKDFDPHVERTSQRPLANGELRPGNAKALLLVLLCIAFALVLMTNGLTIALSLGGAALALTYPLFKRFTHWPQVVLGAAFGWGIIMAFSAETGTVPAVAWWLFLANVLWSVIYDTQYAMVDRDDDRLIGVKSTAILFGRHDRLIIGLFQGTMLLVLVWIGVMLGFQAGWWVALIGVAGMFFWQQRLLRDRDRSACFTAFLSNNWVGALLFVAVILETLGPGISGA